MTADAHVVGSGPNGLAAALVLAEAGLAVEVHEAQPTFGGGARSAELTLPGFVHDLCSAIHPLAVGSPFFETLPLERHGLRWIHPGAPCAHPLDDGSAAVCERSIDATAESLGEDGARWRSLFAPLVEDAGALFEDLLAPPVHVPRHPIALVRFAWRVRRSARRLAFAEFNGERARALFAGMAAHSVLPLESLPTAAFGAILTIAAHAVGWPMPEGGAQRIADALVALLRERGGSLSASDPVRDVDALDRDGFAMLDVAPAAAERIAGARFDARYRRRLRAFPHGPGAFQLHWALDGPIPWRAAPCRRAGTVHVGGTFDEIADAERAVADGAHPERPFVLLAQQSLFDPSRAPEGKHTAWAYCHVPNGSSTDMTQRIESQVERFAPGFKKRILARHATPAAALAERDENLVGGDFSGGSHRTRFLLARPRALRPYATPDPRIFLCSASTPPGGGVHGMCGFHAARAALRGRG